MTEQPREDVARVKRASFANGGNRTGRVFTGDSAVTGCSRVSTRMVATVRCAPPANKPTTAERDTCAGTGIMLRRSTATMSS